MTSRRIPGQCRECSADAVDGRGGRCDRHADAHAVESAERRAWAIEDSRCVVCHEPAVRVDGRTLTLCTRHAEYYRARGRRA